MQRATPRCPARAGGPESGAAELPPVPAAARYTRRRALQVSALTLAAVASPTALRAAPPRPDLPFDDGSWFTDDTGWI